jgi:hypothetical protein
MTEPCKDCPPTPLPVPGTKQAGHRINVLLNHEGPQVDIYRTLVYAIPEGELESGRPIGHDDGSLEFPQDHPQDLYGYTRDSENPRRFHPAWPECVHRILGVFIHDKQLKVAGHCHNPKAELCRHPVTMDQCQACSARQPVTTYKPRPSTVSEMVAAMIAKGRPVTEARIQAKKQ